MFTDLRQYQALQEVNYGYWFDEAGVFQGEKAVWSPLPENATQTRIIPRSLILHANAGSEAATWQQLKNFLLGPHDDGLEPHFDVDNTGTAAQFMSIFTRADCNFNANSWVYQGKTYGAISIETGDFGSATLDVTPWNNDQLHVIIAIGTALAAQQDTGCGEVLSWDGKGIDFHTKFPYVNETVKAWSKYAGKTCPGKIRKRQTPFIRQAVADRICAYIARCSELGVPHGIAGL